MCIMPVYIFLCENFFIWLKHFKNIWVNLLCALPLSIRETNMNKTGLSTQRGRAVLDESRRVGMKYRVFISNKWENVRVRSLLSVGWTSNSPLFLRDHLIFQNLKQLRKMILIFGRYFLFFHTWPRKIIHYFPFSEHHLNICKRMNKNNTPYRIYSITLLYALHNYHIITFNLHRGLAGQRKPKQETEVLPSRGNRYRHLGSWGDWDLGGRVLERRTLEKRSFRNTQRLSGLCLNEHCFANTCRVTQEGLAEKSTPGAESWAVTLEGTQCLDMWAFSPSERRDVMKTQGIQLRHQKAMFLE